MDLKADLERRTGLPVVVENDGNAAAWGEFAFGAAEDDCDDLLLVTVGTGVGGGIVLDGELYRGTFGVAGEVGHIRIEREGRLCGCGNCTAAWSSTAAAARWCATPGPPSATGPTARDALLDQAGGDVGRSPAR